MIAYKFNYKHTVHTRQATSGGMDSELSYAQVQDASLTIVVPEDSAYWYHAAEIYVLYFASNVSDPDFAYNGPAERIEINVQLDERKR